MGIEGPSPPYPCVACNNVDDAAPAIKGGPSRDQRGHVMQGLWDALQPWVVSAAGGFLGALFLLPTQLGQALIKFRFDKMIEAAKAESSRDVERLREQLAHLSDRGKRSNELEFAAVQAVWEKVVEAGLSASTAAYSFLEFPDLRSLDHEELRSYLELSGFSQEQIIQVGQADDRNDAFTKVTIWRQIATARTDIFEANLLLKRQRIFMPDGLRAQFQELIDLMNGAVVERKLNVQHPHIPRSEWGGAVLKFAKEFDSSFEALAKAVNLQLVRAGE